MATTAVEERTTLQSTEQTPASLFDPEQRRRITNEIFKLHEQGAVPNRQIGKRLGISRTTVAKILKSGGVVRTPNADRNKHVTDNMIREERKQGLSHRKIAKKYRISHSAVRDSLKRSGEVWQPPQVTAAELKECRLDPAWEARQALAGRVLFRNRVVCRECGNLLAEINASGEHSHLRTHNMTAEDYAHNHPGARFCSFARSLPTSESQMAIFAAKYATAKELIQCRRDPLREKRQGIRELVVCRRCGFKAKNHISTHLRHDGYSGEEPTKQYQAEYPYAPTMSLEFKEDKADYAKTHAETEQSGRSIGRPPNKKLRRRVRELRAKGTSWGRVKVILDKELEEKRALSTYRGYAENV